MATAKKIDEAVKNAVGPATDTAATPAVVITAKDKALAEQSMKQALGEQGIINKAETKVNTLVFALAEVAVKQTTLNGVGDLPAAILYFEAECAAAEDYAKRIDNAARQEANKKLPEAQQDNGGERSIRDICPVWSTHKSNILAGMKLGLNPLAKDDEEVPTYGTAARYLTAVREAKKKAPRAPQQAAGPMTEKELQLQTVKLGIEAGLATALGQLTGICRKLSAAEQIVAVNDVVACYKAIEARHALSVQVDAPAKGATPA